MNDKTISNIFSAARSHQVFMMGTRMQENNRPTTDELKHGTQWYASVGNNQVLTVQLEHDTQWYAGIGDQSNYQSADAAQLGQQCQ